MTDKKEEVTWSRSNGSLFEKFALSLGEYTRTGKVPSEGDQDIQYGLELQKKRLKKKGLIMQYKFEPRGFLTGKNKNFRRWRDEHYTSRLEYRTCRMERNFFRGTTKEYGKHKNMTFYQTITDVNKPQLIGNDAYNCPGCGAATTIAELHKGCPYCGACFQISDIFPKVSNYYFLWDFSMTKEELRAYLGKFMAGTGILSFLMTLAKNYFFNPDSTKTLASLLPGALLGAIIGGVMLGYFFASLFLIGKLLWESGRTVPLLPSLTSGKSFVRRMKKYSPEFSYEYFSNKVVSLLKVLIFAEKPSEIPVYIGEPLGNIFENIVDVFYAGAVTLKRFRVEGDFCFVTVDVFLDNLYDNGKRISERRDKCRVQLKKDISKPLNMYFSIKHLQCKGCGMSFDATKEKNCPGCGTPYNLENEDWVVTKIIKK